MTFTGSVEDRMAIRDLWDAYSDAVCQNDADRWGALWAEDSAWHMPDFPEYGSIEGKQAIVDMWVNAMQDYPGIIFTTTAGSIEIDGDTASGTCYTSEVFDKDGQCHRHRGYYVDEFVRIDGRWYFKSRSFRTIHKHEV